MELNQHNAIEKSRLVVGGMAWVLGLLLAASDGPYMPWGNLLGIFIFLGGTVTLSLSGDGAAFPKKIPGHPSESFRCIKPHSFKPDTFPLVSLSPRASRFDFKAGQMLPFLNHSPKWPVS